MAEVVLQGVSKTFSSHVAAVQDLNLTIQDHELIVLVGPSGCGKTTTLRLIAGLDHLSHGVIKMNGQRVNHVVPRDRNIAMVFQHSALYPHLTAYDNIAFGLRIRHGSSWVRRLWERLGPSTDRRHRPEREAIDEAVRRTSRALGLGHLLGRRPQELSGGERQRVALGRAIVRQPAAFLLDEPLAHLDPQRRTEVRRVIKKIQRQLGATMVYVTHDQAEAMSLGDRIAVMCHGRIHQVGSPQEIYEQPANQFVATFMGEPAMNLVTGRVQLVKEGAEGKVPCFRNAALTWQLAGIDDANRWGDTKGGAVVVGIRPEHLQLAPVAAASVRHDCVTKKTVTKKTVTKKTVPEKTVPEKRTGTKEQGTSRRQDNPGDNNTSRPESQREGRYCELGVGRVTSREMLGATTVVTVCVSDATAMQAGSVNGALQHAPPDFSPNCGELTALLPSDAPVAVGQQVAIGVDSGRIHWFDAETGKNLNWAASSGERPTDLSAPSCERQRRKTQRDGKQDPT